jgi:hypothetical protein
LLTPTDLRTLRFNRYLKPALDSDISPKQILIFRKSLSGRRVLDIAQEVGVPIRSVVESRRVVRNCLIDSLEYECWPEDYKLQHASTRTLPSSFKISKESEWWEDLLNTFCFKRYAGNERALRSSEACKTVEKPSTEDLVAFLRLASGATIASLAKARAQTQEQFKHSMNNIRDFYLRSADDATKPLEYKQRKALYPPLSRVIDHRGFWSNLLELDIPKDSPARQGKATSHKPDSLIVKQFVAYGFSKTSSETLAAKGIRSPAELLTECLSAGQEALLLKYDLRGHVSKQLQSFFESHTKRQSSVRHLR